MVNGIFYFPQTSCEKIFMVWARGVQGARPSLTDWRNLGRVSEIAFFSLDCMLPRPVAAFVTRGTSFRNQFIQRCSAGANLETGQNTMRYALWRANSVGVTNTPDHHWHKRRSKLNAPEVNSTLRSVRTATRPGQVSSVAGIRSPATSLFINLINKDFARDLNSPF